MKKLLLLIVSMATLCCCTEQNLPNNSNGSNEETKDTTNTNGGENEQYVETYRLDGYETYHNDTAYSKNVLFYNAESILDSNYVYSGRNNQWIPSSKFIYFKNAKTMIAEKQNMIGIFIKKMFGYSINTIKTLYPTINYKRHR